MDGDVEGGHEDGVAPESRQSPASPQVPSSTEKGRWGEALVARHLHDRGWTILDRNWRAGPVELDLVVRKGRILAFVEVKTRFGAGFGHPLEAVTPRKRKEVERVARAWLRARGSGELRGGVLRFDAVSVEVGPRGAPRIRHFPDAWRIGDG